MHKVAGIILLVNDIERSVAFYKKLGFTVTKQVGEIATTVSLGDFWIELLHVSKVVSDEYKEDANRLPKGAGSYLQVQVDDIDIFYSMISTKGIEFIERPKNYPWKHREFIVGDPDGYKIAFFTPI